MRLTEFFDEYIAAALATGGLPDGVALLHEVDALGSPAPAKSSNPAPSTGNTGTTTWTKETAPARFASAGGRATPPAIFGGAQRTIPPAYFKGSEDEDDVPEEILAAVFQDLEDYSQENE